MYIHLPAITMRVIDVQKVEICPMAYFCPDLKPYDADVNFCLAT